MNLTKFLFIDIVLVMAGLSLWIMAHAHKGKSLLLNNLKDGEEIDLSALKLPNQQKLLELEAIARKDGSGISSESLIGLWQFISVWKQANDQEDLFMSALLRLFSASLDIKKGEANQFVIANSIQFGFLSIRFKGSGNLKGKQPLLPFFFDCIEFKAGSSVVFSRFLPKPDEMNMPFFALISIEQNGKWLSARGRGGGLALWVKG
ncbi:hypothetical protein [Prochlorococcus sp. MIT 1341]|uniref:hypothetical protein n=1 Tax=Prochlorococcus sp. MIT 1341 TaxID=3096221 RepID=UPI002A753067|nr:hypothetical protein [Prochlorococcus sp. MIT 1341]